MVGLVDVPEAARVQVQEFVVRHQQVELDFDFVTPNIRGKTTLQIIPQSIDLKTVRLNCRQCRILKVAVNGKPVGGSAGGYIYTDPYKQSKLPWLAGVHQFHMLQERIEDPLKSVPTPELVINLPKAIKIQKLDPSSAAAIVGGQNGDASTIDLDQSSRTVNEQIPLLTPISIMIEFSIEDIRNGIHFVGWRADDLRYPHAYSLKAPGSTSCIFPCIDTIDSRCTWELSFRTPRTIGDAVGTSRSEARPSFPILGRKATSGREEIPLFSAEDRAIDLLVVCSGDLTDEIVDKHDPSKKTTVFRCAVPVSPQHVGFAIGPFEQVDLTAFREGDEDQKLGERAVPVSGYCLPGRASELRNTCFPIVKAIDFLVVDCGAFPFTNYKVCFVDDQIEDCIDTATLSICSSKLLFPEDIIEPLDRVTRQLVYAVACQWVGVDIIPKDPSDLWVVVGIAHFIADIFMRKLSGNNEYRYHYKRAAERVCELDVARPSIYELGPFVRLDPTQDSFIALKAPLVLFILDRRLAKMSGSSGISRIVNRICLQANLGELPNGSLTTAHFIKTCERVGHAKLETFFNQWVFGAGCPRFRVTQRFNKKKLVVEMLIQQAQGDIPEAQDIEPSTFMRDVKEEIHGVYATGLQPVFLGPMTIRIHEADGTPYEHIVDIKESMTKFDIPYNTKYKRLKRSRRQKERTAVGSTNEYSAENQDDVLLYCLGDVLQTEDEIRDFRLADWSKEEEDRMNQESYEWIRMDADFEWICKMSISMPGYMFVSQLQQDRDVVAQYESIQYLAAQREHPLVSTILLRTLMDSRYFHGIRTAAAQGLVRHAKDEIGWLGLHHLEKAFQELFCYPKSRMTRSNNFSDRASYYIQCAIPKAIAKIRDNNGRAPFSVRSFLYEKLRYNDNSDNEFSDGHYLSILMTALSESAASAPPFNEDTLESMGESGDDFRFFKSCLEEIDRYRRIDEWIPSYQNILTVTALHCKARLAKAGSVPTKSADFLQYTQNGCYDFIRVTAFDCLLDLGMISSDWFLKWLLFVTSHDFSPYIRSNLKRLLGRSLGSIAVGRDKSQANAASSQRNGLTIEEESTTEARQADLARRQSISGALAALKSELGENMALKDALWDAIESPLISLFEMTELLEICSLLYYPETSSVVVLKYPRYWRCARLDTASAQGQRALVMRFYKSERVRTKMRVKMELPAPAPMPISKPMPPPLKRQDSISSATGGPGKLILKLKTGTPRTPSFPPSQTDVANGSAAMMTPKTPATPGGDGQPKIKLKLRLTGFANSEASKNS